MTTTEQTPTVAVLAAAVVDYHRRLDLDIDAVAFVEVLDEHGIDLDDLELLAAGVAAVDPSEALRAVIRRAIAQRRELQECLEAQLDYINRRRDEDERAAHARHVRWGWPRWRITHRVLSWAYVVGLITATGVRYNGHCRGCVDLVRVRGRRPYIAGRRREWWFCLLRGRHIHRPIDATPYLCAVCAPCPECGSTDPAHDLGPCESAADAARAGGAGR